MSENILCVNCFMANRFPELLKKLRDDSKLTQDQLAEMVGFHKNNIVRYESGEASPRFVHLMQIIDALGCSPNEIFGWELGLKMRCKDDKEPEVEPGIVRKLG